MIGYGRYIPSRVEECDDDTHEGNGIYGDLLTPCPDCEEAAEDAYEDYMEQRAQDRELDRWDD
jgi:hypothetical protein